MKFGFKKLLVVFLIRKSTTFKWNFNFEPGFERTFYSKFGISSRNLGNFHPTPTHTWKGGITGEKLVDDVLGVEDAMVGAGAEAVVAKSVGGGVCEGEDRVTTCEWER